MRSLRYLVLFQNRLEGPLPETIGSLRNLTWLDVSGNRLSGALPVSQTSSIGSGLDNLTNALHFHLQNNSFTGSLPASMFHSGMQLIHLLLNDNQLNGSIPATIGDLPVVQIIALNSNNLNGSVPSNISAIETLITLQLDTNDLSDPLPDLSNLSGLQMLTLGNNPFDAASTIPTWITNLKALYLLSMDSSNLNGTVPPELFSFSPYLSNVSLGSNNLQGTLNLTQANVSSLKLVNLTGNQILDVVLGNYNQELLLDGNPYCTTSNANCSFIPTVSTTTDTSRPPSTCTNKCPVDYEINPKAPSGCQCSRPVTATCTFFASKVPLLTVYGVSVLEQWFAEALSKSQYLQSVTVNDTQAVVDILSQTQVTLSVFPSDNATVWNLGEAALISYVLQNQDIEFPSVGAWGCVIIGVPYSVTTVVNGSNGLSMGVKIGIGVGAGLMVIIISVLAVFAWKLRTRALKAEKLSKPFEPWLRRTDGNGDPNIPQLKGARVFSFAELSKCTSGFNKSNELGEGGYGKVYKGILETGEEVAIKRASKGSMQGIGEFKNEVELLSRLHHRNLVALLGFCYEQDEQLLVYEYLPNGTLRDCLSGRTSTEMNWRTRVALALGSARGITYLHTEASPPIIHSDIKSSNILLDHQLVAKVADFGLSKLASYGGVDNRLEHVTAQVKGTMGYLDPDYFMTNRLTDKSDVYSFGVVLLEVLTGRLPIENGQFIVREVRNSVVREKGDAEAVLQELVDPRLQGEYPVEAAEVLLGVALSCVHDDPDKRPPMSEVVKELDSIQVQQDPFHGAKMSASVIKNHSVDLDALYSHANPGSTTSTSAFSYSGSYVGMSAPIEPK